MSFQQGLSGLNAASKTLEVIGNNVANANTVGFKQSQAQFADVFANSLTGAGGNQVGIGSKLTAVSQQFTQGTITTSNNPLDVAINGGGFFRMSSNGVVSYARNGQFQLDGRGNIVNASGSRLTGYAVNADGVLETGAPKELSIRTDDIPPQASTKVDAVLNLDSRLNPPANSFSVSDPLSYNNATSVSVFDSLGNAHVLQTYYVKNGTNSWDVFASNDGAPVGYIAGTAATSPAGTIAPAGAPTDVGTTVAAGTFSINGVSIGAIGPATATATRADNMVTAINAAAIPGVTASLDSAGGVVINSTAEVKVTLNGSAKNEAAATANRDKFLAQTGLASAAVGTQAVLPPVGTLNFKGDGSIDTQNTTLPVSVTMQVASGAYTPFSVNIGYTGTTQFGSTFGVNTLAQDGYASGRLSGFQIGADGVISGRYTNGKSQTLGQVVLANFTNPSGLQPLGNNTWAESADSGQPMVGAPDSGNLGVLQSSAVEDSNVDMTAELVNMITAQRVYQANAQTIKTQDQILQTLVNMR